MIPEWNNLQITVEEKTSVKLVHPKNQNSFKQTLPPPIKENTVPVNCHYNQGYVNQSGTDL
jgi:hypothetical protein